MNEPKAIETCYSGHRFRSRLEARYAVMFDRMGLEWEYETEGYHLPSGDYLPDFWLPQVLMWAEVKPDRLTGREFALCRELAIATGFDVLLLDGKPNRRFYSAISAAMLPGAEGDERDFGKPIIAHYDIFEPHQYWRTERRFYFVQYGKTLEAEKYHRAPAYWYDGDEAPLPTLADELIRAANMARFEHGETGAA